MTKIRRKVFFKDMFKDNLCIGGGMDGPPLLRGGVTPPFVAEAL